MHTTIFYYTGTGNSLWAARRLADQLEETEIISISNCQDELEAIHSKTIGLIFPVHIWGVPVSIVRFVRTLRGLQPDYVFAIAANGGQVANTLVQLKENMAENNLTLSAGFALTMPSNYAPFGGPGSEEEQNERFGLAQKKILQIADRVKEKADLPVERGSFWQRILSATVYKLSIHRVPQMDRSFWVDEKCNGCGICQKVCPAENITLREGKPDWNHRCEQCFACLQWCPKEAIQHGKNTSHRERYHHPEVVLKDLLRSRQLG